MRSVGESVAETPESVVSWPLARAPGPSMKREVCSAKAPQQVDFHMQRNQAGPSASVAQSGSAGIRAPRTRAKTV